MKRLKQLVLLLSCVFFFSSCGKIDRGESITIVGSSAMQPLAEAVGEEYSAKHTGEFINVQGGGSGTGLSQVQSGAVNIGNSDLFAEEKEGIDATALVDHRVAVVGITPIVNKEIGLENISMENLKKIFSGDITNWKEIGGNDLDVVILNRADGSGTRYTFEKWVMDGTATKRSQEQESTGMVRQIVADTPGAISYLAFSYVTEDVHTLSIDAIEPTEDNVINNSWPIWSYEHMYTKGEATGLTKEYLDYVLSNDMQSTVIKQLGYISVSEMTVERDAQGNTTQIKATSND